MKKKILIFVVTYNAERTIADVLSRVPAELLEDEALDVELLVIDDSSQDETVQRGFERSQANPALPITVLSNPRNLGYGGNQKLGYRYAIDHGFDIVALLHGDGQYAPEELPRLVRPLCEGSCAAVFGSRMMPPGKPLQGGMPLYKFLGNKVLSRLQNAVIGTDLSEWHSGYRLYSCRALELIPFELNSDGFDFDTDIIIQLHRAGCSILELPIPTFYGDEICHVNGLPYAARILSTCVKNALQAAGLLYDPKFDLAPENAHYLPKFDFASSHSFALGAVSGDESVLVLGAGSGPLLKPFRNKGCRVVAIDIADTPEIREACDQFILADLDELTTETLDSLPSFDKVLALDVIEHLKDPEGLIAKLRASVSTRDAAFVMTTPNVAFVIVRIMLLLGSFNYGKRGILDLTHTRLFTFFSFQRMLQQGGMRVEKVRGVPAPFPLALGSTNLSRLLLGANKLAMRLSRSLFAYQIYVEARANPTTRRLLERAVTLGVMRKRLFHRQRPPGEGLHA